LFVPPFAIFPLIQDFPILLFNLRFDVVVAFVFLANFALRKYILREGSHCGCDASHCGNWSFTSLYQNWFIYTFNFIFRWWV